MLLTRGLLLAFLALVVGCDAPKGAEFPLDRQKLLVSDDDYLTEKECWGDIDLSEKGIWIPVEFAVDETEYFTKVGILSRTCELASVVDFEREARQLPKYYPFEAHAEFFGFVFSDRLKDPDRLFKSSKLLTSLSTVTVRYSDAVIFFDGYVKLGADARLPNGVRRAYNVVEVRRD